MNVNQLEKSENLPESKREKREERKKKLKKLWWKKKKKQQKKKMRNEGAETAGEPDQMSSLNLTPIILSEVEYIYSPPKQSLFKSSLRSG